jgi:hypothetical protein
MWIHKIVRRNGYKSSKKWKGGGDGSDVKQMFIEIDKIKKWMEATFNGTTLTLVQCPPIAQSRAQ